MEIYNLIILDESGSMDSIKRETIKGFNDTLRVITGAQKEFPEQKHYITLCTFNGEGIRFVHENVAPGDTTKLGQEDYKPNSTTPLFDAIGLCVKRLDKGLADRSDYRVLVTIITDGEENVSAFFDEKEIQAMIESRKEKDWIFTYMGANHDVKSFASKISIESSVEYAADAEGVTAVNDLNDQSRTRAYHGFANKLSSRFIGANFFEDTNKLNDNYHETLSK